MSGFMGSRWARDPHELRLCVVVVIESESVLIELGLKNIVAQTKPSSDYGTQASKLKIHQRQDWFIRPVSQLSVQGQSDGVFILLVRSLLVVVAGLMSPGLPRRRRFVALGRTVAWLSLTVVRALLSLLRWARVWVVMGWRTWNACRPYYKSEVTWYGLPVVASSSTKPFTIPHNTCRLFPHSSSSQEVDASVMSATEKNDSRAARVRAHTHECDRVRKRQQKG
ncbi:hypothetical protein EVAR_94724_1 [Eumeta japonica]|uniref:Uncharacterized protein n=1 Tax=Eumeta variegata TaxID=151549 RepID=A0A4C1UXQ1_EUMVA|nr:hypothetical protein EVAR_94724_1 [Eumeta japonica]